MCDQSWKWAVEIQQLVGRQFVCVVEDGNVSIRGFDCLPDAERFAESERRRMNLCVISPAPAHPAPL